MRYFFVQGEPDLFPVVWQVREKRHWSLPSKVVERYASQDSATMCAFLLNHLLGKNTKKSGCYLTEEQLEFVREMIETVNFPPTKLKSP